MLAVRGPRMVRIFIRTQSTSFGSACSLGGALTGARGARLSRSSFSSSMRKERIVPKRVPIGDPTRHCRRNPYQIQRYISRIGGPLQDRIDIHIEVPRVPYRELEQARGGAIVADPKQSSRPSREPSSCQAER